MRRISIYSLLFASLWGFHSGLFQLRAAQKEDKTIFNDKAIVLFAQDGMLLIDDKFRRAVFHTIPEFPDGFKPVKTEDTYYLDFRREGAGIAIIIPGKEGSLTLQFCNDRWDVEQNDFHVCYMCALADSPLSMNGRKLLFKKGQAMVSQQKEKLSSNYLKLAPDAKGNLTWSETKVESEPDTEIRILPVIDDPITLTEILPKWRHLDQFTNEESWFEFETDEAIMKKFRLAKGTENPFVLATFEIPLPTEFENVFSRRMIALNHTVDAKAKSFEGLFHDSCYGKDAFKKDKRLNRLLRTKDSGKTWEEVFSKDWNNREIFRAFAPIR